MHEHGLAKELWPMLQQIASDKGLECVRRVEMVVGLLHGVSAEFLAHSFEHLFAGSVWEGAAVEVQIVEPGQEYTVPGSDAAIIATGWELLVTHLEDAT